MWKSGSGRTPEPYQGLLDAAAFADAEEGIRQELEVSRENRVCLARQFFDEFEARGS
jgi:hypothetical protein